MKYKSPVIWREVYERDKKKWFQKWAITVLVAFITLIGSFCYFQEEAFLARKSNVLQGVVDDYKIKFEILDLLRTKGISLNQGLDIANMTVIQSKQLGLPLPLVLAIMGKESEYLPHAISNKGAKGLMQLIPATFDLYIKKLNLGVTQSAIFDPIVNVLVATHYLKDLYDKYKGETKTEDEAWKLALSCYNSGPLGGIQKNYIKDVNKLSLQIDRRLSE